jgi:hypothetical protein
VTAHQNTQTIIDAIQKETAIGQQQHSCETLICQRHQTILRCLSTAATASTVASSRTLLSDLVYRSADAFWCSELWWLFFFSCRSVEACCRPSDMFLMPLSVSLVTVQLQQMSGVGHVYCLSAVANCTRKCKTTCYKQAYFLLEWLFKFRVIFHIGKYDTDVSAKTSQNTIVISNTKYPDTVRACMSLNAAPSDKSPPRVKISFLKASSWCHSISEHCDGNCHWCYYS